MLVLALLALRPISTVADLDALARARDIDGLRKVLTFKPGDRDPLRVVKFNGAYEVGRFGWNAFSLKSPDGQEFAILGTKLTSEDIGELVFRRVGDAWVYVDESETLGVRIRHHNFGLQFDVPAKRADLEDRVTLTSEGTGDFLMRMSSAYVVKSITDEGGKEVPFRQSSGVIAVQRPTKREATYTLKYGGVVNLPMYAGSITNREATLVNDYWYPMIGRLPATYEISIAPPTGWRAIAQGVPVPTRDARIHYRMDLPVVYFSVLAAPFTVVEQKIGTRTFRALSTRLDKDKLRRQTELTAPIVDFYSRTFGPWPFDGYGQVDSAQYGGGALEAYSFATYGGWLPSEDAHEPAHTYWGGLINNTYLKSFWNESFAVFSDGLYHRNVGIGNRDERRRAFVQVPHVDDNYKQVPIMRGGADVGGIASDLGYGKGAFVLQMLEQWLGTAEVTGAMREWVATQPKGQPGEWEDFERIVTKRNPSRDVKGFFDDWGRRAVWADFGAKVDYAGGTLRIDLDWHGPRYRMPLTVYIQERDGNERYETVWVDGSGDALRIPVKSKPLVVSIDPFRQALRSVEDSERPLELENGLQGLRRVGDPSHPDWLKGVGAQREVADDGELAGKFFVGSPTASPRFADLCKRAGFEVKGNRLTYKGTTIDLNQGAALAVFQLENGKRCAIGLGKTEHPIDFGHARLIVTDRLGRFLRGETLPKTKGPLTFRLP